MLFRAIKHLFTKDKLLANLIDEGYPFRVLMRMWRYSITRLLRENFGKLVLPEALEEAGSDIEQWNKLLDHHYHRHWHVYIAKETTEKSHTQRYLGRYLKKPPVSAKRLLHIGGRMVELEYLDHRDGKHKRKAVSQEEMALRVLSHLPEKHLRMVRYYGFLSNRLRGECLQKIHAQLAQKLSLQLKISFAAMMKLMNVDPFECILCGSRMRFAKMTLGLVLAERVLQLKTIALLKRPVGFIG